jgi:signal transduction histidine kinase
VHLQGQQQRTQHETGRLEALVRERTAQLTELAQHLQTAREDERQRLARDLHDELGALLTSAKLDAARIRSRLAAPVPLIGEAQERLTHLATTLDQVIAVKRRIAEDLRPSALSHLGLVATLEILAREFTRSSGVLAHCALQPVPLASAAELTAYRLVQEATTNIAKHAHASNVWLTLRLADGQVLLEVRDDGSGFDTTMPPRSAYGLVGMRYRVEAEHGTLAVVAAPGRGTTIRVTLPPRPTLPPAA